MNKSTISFLKGKYGNRAIELEDRFSSINIILKNVLKDLIDETQDLQINRKYNEVMNVIEIQKSINDAMDLNLNVINELKLDDNQEKLVAEENKKAKKTENTQTTLDYDEYLVDTNIPHNLQEDYRHKRPHAFSINDHYVEVSTWKEMLAATCDYLYNLNPEIFKSFVDDKSMHWGKTYNFSKDINALRTGTLVNGSDIYIETSKDSIAVRQLVIKMLEKYMLDLSVYKVFLRADYTERHK